MLATEVKLIDKKCLCILPGDYDYAEDRLIMIDVKNVKGDEPTQLKENDHIYNASASIRKSIEMLIIFNTHFIFIQ